VGITLMQRENEVIVKVQDDGKGVVEGIVELRPGSTGVGIGGMSERAREFGGQLKLTNAHPGTIVEVIIPRSLSVPSDGPRGREEKLAVLRTARSPDMGQASVGYEQ
jgi:signal transduction histidine kinase